MAMQETDTQEEDAPRAYFEERPWRNQHGAGVHIYLVVENMPAVAVLMSTPKRKRAFVKRLEAYAHDAIARYEGGGGGASTTALSSL